MGTELTWTKKKTETNRPEQNGMKGIETEYNGTKRKWNKME
jgi:hypothetical protein